MKAIAVFPYTIEVRVIEQEVPHLAEPDHVKVCMLEICAYEYGMPPEGSDYLVIGWETFGLQGARPHIAIV